MTTIENLIKHRLEYFYSDTLENNDMLNRLYLSLMEYIPVYGTQLSKPWTTTDLSNLLLIKDSVSSIVLTNDYTVHIGNLIRSGFKVSEHEPLIGMSSILAIITL